VAIRPSKKVMYENIKMSDAYPLREYATLVAGNIPSNSRFIKERVSQASSFQASKKFDESRLETWRMSMENEKQNYFDATHIKAFK